ncbi:MAG: hypothetical protein WB762_26965 [Candidatus Sulfotelmatobacter sp.]
MRVENLRLEAARLRLESTAASLEEVAKFSDFKSVGVLRRVLRDGWVSLRTNIASHLDVGGTRIQRLEQSSPQVVLSRVG